MTAIAAFDWSVWVVGLDRRLLMNSLGLVMLPYLREARPRQYVKNVLVFAAPGAAGVLTEPSVFLSAMVAFVALCLAASGTYYWNDVLDVESDRRHPTKSARPIAAGEIGVPTARVVGSLLLVAALGIAATNGWQLTAVVGAYIVLTSTYSTVWKHVAVVDLIAIASGFFLRAAAGAVATDVGMSSWFVLVTVFGALFIVAGKRYAEARQLGDAAGSRRATLDMYTPEFLRFVMAVACGSAIMSYSVWAFETVAAADHEWPLYEASIAPMIAALLRYALVIETGGGAAPEEVFLADRPLQLLGLVWVAMFTGAVYL